MPKFGASGTEELRNELPWRQSRYFVESNVVYCRYLPGQQTQDFEFFDFGRDKVTTVFRTRFVDYEYSYSIPSEIEKSEMLGFLSRQISAINKNVWLYQVVALAPPQFVP